MCKNTLPNFGRLKRKETFLAVKLIFLVNTLQNHSHLSQTQVISSPFRHQGEAAALNNFNITS